MGRESLSVVRVPRKQTLADAIIAGISGYLSGSSEARKRQMEEEELVLKQREALSQEGLRQAQGRYYEDAGGALGEQRRASAALGQAKIKNLRQNIGIQRQRATTARMKAFMPKGLDITKNLGITKSVNELAASDPETANLLAQQLGIPLLRKSKKGFFGFGKVNPAYGISGIPTERAPMRPPEDTSNLRQQAIAELKSAGAPLTESNIQEVMRQLGS